MEKLERSHVILSIGIGCLVVSGGLLYLGAPAYTTSIIAQEPDEEAMAATVESYSPSEIDSVAFSNLSSAEQTAVVRASKSSQLTYTNHRLSDSGGYFEYRNDVANSYFVRYNESMYLVHVVISMDPLLIGVGILGGTVGVVLLLGGGWRSYRGN